MHPTDRGIFCTTRLVLVSPTAFVEQGSTPIKLAASGMCNALLPVLREDRHDQRRCTTMNKKSGCIAVDTAERDEDEQQGSSFGHHGRCVTAYLVPLRGGSDHNDSTPSQRRKAVRSAS